MLPSELISQKLEASRIESSHLLGIQRLCCRKYLIQINIGQLRGVNAMDPIPCFA